MPDRLIPPFEIKASESAYWIVDAEGSRFGYVYFRKSPLIGTDPNGKLSQELALETVKWIARAATDRATR